MLLIMCCKSYSYAVKITAVCAVCATRVSLLKCQICKQIFYFANKINALGADNGRNDILDVWEWLIDVEVWNILLGDQYFLSECCYSPLAELCQGNSGAYFTKSLWAHNSNFINIYVAFMWKIIMRSGHKFCTCHDSWAVMACVILWTDHIMRIKIREKFIFIYDLINDLWDGWMVGLDVRLAVGGCKGQGSLGRLLKIYLHHNRAHWEAHQTQSINTRSFSFLKV